MTTSMSVLALIAVIGLVTGISVPAGARERLRTLRPIEIIQFIGGPALLAALMFSKGDAKWVCVVLGAGPVWVAFALIANVLWHREQ